MQKSRAKRLSPTGAVLITLAVCLAAFLLAVLRHTTGADGSSAVRRVNVSQVKSVKVLENGLVFYNGTTLGYVSPSGSVKWTYMAGGDARYEATEYGVAVWKGRSLTLLNIKDGSIYYSVPQSDDIISVSIGPQYAAVVVGEDMNSKVTLLNGSGHFVKTLSFDSQLLLKYGFYSGGQYFWALALESDGTVAGTTVSTYKPASQLVSGSITDNSQVTYDCMFLSDRIVCVGETYVKTYEYTGVEDLSRRSLVYGWYMKQCDTSQDPLMLFLTDRQYSGADPIQDVMALQKDKKRYLHFPFGCDSVYACEGIVYGFSCENGCVMRALPASQEIGRSIPGLQFDTVYGVMKGGIAAVSANGQMYLIKTAA